MRKQKKHWVPGGRVLAWVLAAAMGISTLGYTGSGQPLTVQAAEVQIATVTANTLNVRTGAGTNYSKLVSDGEAVFLKKGETAQILAEENGWYQVTFAFQGKEVTGYISGDYVTVSTEKVAGSVNTIQIATVTATTLNVRTGAGTGNAKLVSDGEAVFLKQGETAQILAEENGWYQVTFSFLGKKVTGYISGDYVTVSTQKTESPKETPAETPVKEPEGTGSENTGTENTEPKETAQKDTTEYLPIKVPGRITATSLRVRKGPGTGYAQLTVKKKGVSLEQKKKVYITGYEDRDGERWYQISVTFNGEKVSGYVLSDYVTLVVTEGERPNVKAYMNAEKYVSEEASTASAKILTHHKEKVYLEKGEACTIIGEKTVSGEKWYLIKFFFDDRNLKGYVPAEYVDIERTEVVQESIGTSQPKVEYEPLKIAGRVQSAFLKVRTGPGTGYDQLKVYGTGVTLKEKKKIHITDVVEEKGERWYQISVTFNGVKVTGYAATSRITLVETEGERVKIDAVLNAEQYVRSTTSTSEKKILLHEGDKVSLAAGTEIFIISEKTVGGTKWYQVKFSYDDGYLKGYIPSQYVDFKRIKVVKEPEMDENGNGTTGEGTQEEEFQMQQGIVLFGPVEVRTAAGYGSEVVKDNYTGLQHSLTAGQTVTAYAEAEVEGTRWYLVAYEIDQVEYLGFVPAVNIQLNGSSGSVSGGTAGTVMTDAEFELYMTIQGFPESYKPYLRTLHTAHPYWAFKAEQTGLDWNTVITNESKVGINLITNSKNIAWKSMEKGAYNWKTDKFVPYDGSTWVTASKEAVEYYMDPRNFLTETGIYQFEMLSYQPTYQTEAGVESILTGSPMKGSTYSYIDTAGMTQTTTYAKTFMDAAAYSGVSPYHLASRSKQEIVTSSSTLSSSVTGKVSGYEGLYNFYNIGATHSTVAGGAVINGLKYAMNGTPGKNYSSTMTFNDYIMIPWISPYRSIVGGAAFIGNNYIQRGQNTVYLEKFNVTATSTYSHQYMANVEGAAAESKKTAAAYSQLTDASLVFSIPVYLNMPVRACPAPADQLNPNNWLNSLAVDGYSLTPTFDPEVDQAYSLIVDNSVEQVTINAKTASSKATVTGAGVMKLVLGNNTAVIVVTAENGDARVYILNITRELAASTAE